MFVEQVGTVNVGDRIDFRAQGDAEILSGVVLETGECDTALLQIPGRGSDGKYEFILGLDQFVHVVRGADNNGARGITPMEPGDRIVFIPGKDHLKLRNVSSVVGDVVEFFMSSGCAKVQYGEDLVTYIHGMDHLIELLPSKEVERCA